MRIVCDRCKQQYDADNDTIIKSDKLSYPINKYWQSEGKIEYHLCPLCRVLLCDFIEENIPPKYKGKYQTEKEKDDKIYEDYFNSIDGDAP